MPNPFLFEIQLVCGPASIPWSHCTQHRVWWKSLHMSAAAGSQAGWVGYTGMSGKCHMQILGLSYLWAPWALISGRLDCRMLGNPASVPVSIARQSGRGWGDRLPLPRSWFRENTGGYCSPVPWKFRLSYFEILSWHPAKPKRLLLPPRHCPASQ